MSYIDKTYVTKEQYILAREFWMRTRKKQLREVGQIQWLYPFGYAGWDEIPTDEQLATEADIETVGNDSCLWNTGWYFDLWLLKNCPLDFIIEKLPYLESMLKYKDELDFSSKPRLIQIKNKNSCIDFYSIREKDFYYLDRVLVYGTTYFLEFLDDATNIFRDTDHVLLVDYAGLKLEIKNHKVYHYITKEEVDISIDDKMIRIPNIKYSLNAKDMLKYHPSEIIFSFKDKCFNIEQYKDFNPTNIKRYLLQLPSYIEKQIKR